jgi:hypothetical protein
MCRRGYRVLDTESSLWVEFWPRVYQAFPYHWIIQPSEEEIEAFLRNENAIGLRYSTPIESSRGALSYHAVHIADSYGFDNLGKWARRNTRRGLRRCSVEPINFDLLADEGFALQVDTLDRQGRNLEVKRDRWRRLCSAAIDLPGFEAWGAFVDGDMAASVITFQMEDCSYMLYQQCHRKYLSDYVNNALCYIVSKEMITRPAIKSILYGLHSLDAPPSVDTFKFRMGYTAKRLRQRVVFHPALKPLLNRLSHELLRGLMRIMPGNVPLSKAEGMVRFYRQGLLPLGEQHCPPPLEKIGAIE